MGFIKAKIDDDLHKEIKIRSTELEYKQEELIPILLKEGLKTIKNRK